MAFTSFRFFPGSMWGAMRQAERRRVPLRHRLRSRGDGDHHRLASAAPVLVARANAGELDPPFPMHVNLLGNDKYGITSLLNMSELPETGALLIVAPLRIAGGTGSPARVLALVPTGCGESH